MEQTFNLIIREPGADYQVRGTVDPGDPRTWALHRADPARDPLEIGEFHIHSLSDWDELGEAAPDLAGVLQPGICDRIHCATEERLERELSRPGVLVEADT